MANNNSSSSHRHRPPTTLVFLKMGGSLITDKTQASTPRLDIIKRSAAEISEAMQKKPELRLLLGHGSGSYGHMAADKYGTHHGVQTTEQWQGFIEVWHQAAELNRLILDALHQVGLPAMTFPASAAAIAANGTVKNWNIEPIWAALENGLIPVVYGDVAFDEICGGTILSTEDIFGYLSITLRPSSILLAGDEQGVYADYPSNKQLLKKITPEDISELAPNLTGSAATDVTGGMASKVQQMIDLIDLIPKLKVFIFSGSSAGNIKKALLGKPMGTKLFAS